MGGNYTKATCPQCNKICRERFKPNLVCWKCYNKGKTIIKKYIPLEEAELKIRRVYGPYKCSAACYVILSAVYEGKKVRVVVVDE